MDAGTHLVGVISDTHGLMRPEALAALQGSELIIHAGDVGRPDVLEALRELAPVRAIRGNIDRGDLGRDLPRTELFKIGGVWIYVIHDLAELDLVPASANIGVVVSGHTHRPKVEKRRDVLYINPGSAGPRRFSRPFTLARLHIRDGVVEVGQVELHVHVES